MKSVWTVTGLMVLTGATLQGVVILTAPSVVLTDPSTLIAGLALAVGFALVERWAVNVQLGRQAVSLTLSDVPLVVGLFFLNPILVVALRVLGAAPVVVAQLRNTPRKLFFNLTWLWVEACVAALIWHLLSARPGDVGPATWLAACAVTVVIDLIGTLLISAAVAADSGTRPDLRGVLSEANPVVALGTASFALVIVYVAVADWRALWTTAVVLGVLAFAQSAHHRQRRRTESLEQVRRFTGALGDQVSVDAAATTALRWLADHLSAGRTQLVLEPGFAGERVGWQTDRDGTVAALVGQELHGPDPAALAEPTLVHRGDRSPTNGLPLHDGMLMQLTGDNAVIGTLLVGQRLSEADPFGQHDLGTFVALGNHLSVALRNARRADVIREHAEQQLRKSLQDDVTPLVSRQGLEQQLQLLLDDETGIAVVSVDLNGFAEVNDTFGHTAGDDLLRVVAERLFALAPSDATVGRLHADHFAVVLPGGDPAAADDYVAAVLAAFEQPLPLALAANSVEIEVSVRTGVALTEPTDPSPSEPTVHPITVHPITVHPVTVQPATLLRRALMASVAARSRRAPTARFDPAMEGGTQRLLLLADLRDGIPQGQLRAYVQPKVSVGSGVVLGAEALVRWQHPSRGLMFPDQFVPLAENSGLLGPMTRAVLQQGLAWARQWRQSGHDFGIAVNVSPRSLLDVRFLPMVRDALVEGGVPPERVTLEITESSLMDDPRAAIEALGRLRDLGVQLSIDDLGTGYSSLSYLYKLPVTEIKIDRSFLQPATLTESLDVVGGIVDLGHRLGYKVVAEGVEDERTWTQLIEFGCDVAQGYWIGRPVASDAFAQWLDTWPNTLRGVDGPRAVVPAPRQS